MADKPAAEKTEMPTPKRLGKARGQGQTPQSQELMSFISIVILLTMIAFLGPGLTQWFIVMLNEGLSCNTSLFANSGAFIHFINGKIIDVTVVMFPILLALCVGSIIGGIVVGGFNFAPGAIRWKLDEISPSAGLGKLVNARSVVKLLMCIVKIFFVTLVTWFYLRDKIDMFASLRWTWSFAILTAISKIILGALIRICIALLVIAIADVAYQKWKYMQDLKMTKQEVKEERKQSEGPPEAKKQIRKRQLELAVRRMLQEVPKANVVLVNPTHVAVALRYDGKTMDAPVMVAKGADHVAEKIREIARAYGVPIVRKPELARTIYSTVELNGTIPETLYVAVAEILAMIYKLRHRKG